MRGYMPTVFIIYKQSDIKANHIIPELCSLLECNGYITQSFYIDALPQLELYHDIILLVLGGDGTILSVVNHNCNARFPIISINTGNLGFFTTFSIHAWYDGLIPAIQRHSIEEVSLLHITAGDEFDLALNEVSVTRSGIARNMFIEVDIDGERVYSFTGDGILVATQYGSSAYARSVGGSLIHPTVQAYIIAPIVPSFPALPPIIIPCTAYITLHIQAREATITCDGQRVLPFTNLITIQRAPHTMPFISFLQDNYYSHIRTKGII